MTRIQIGDRVVIAGSHFAAGREGNVSYIGPLFDQMGVKVCLADEENCAPFVEVGSGVWLIKTDGPVVMPDRYVIVPISHLEIDATRVKPGHMVTLPESAGKWAHLSGVVARVCSDACWIALPKNAIGGSTGRCEADGYAECSRREERLCN